MARAEVESRTIKDDEYLLDLKRKFMRAQDICEPARKEWETDQDYYDAKQWTAEEMATLNKRKQPALVFNEVRPAVNGVIGMVERGAVDPKAWGRTPQDADAADVVTDSLRYASDVARFKSTRSQALKDYFIPGICCAVVEIDENREVVVRKGRAEEFFYDPYSREPNFSDARYLGLAKWMDEADVVALYPQHAEAIKSSVNANGLMPSDTHEDRPKGWAWADLKTRRIMVVEMYHRDGVEWRKCVFIAGAMLENGKAPYVDDKGRSFCNLIAQSAYVDRENRRHGIVRDMRGPQDATNKGWSKIIHILNVAKLRVSKRVGDVDEVRKEWAKPDGILQGDKDDVEELGDKQVVPAHVEMLQFADQKMRRVSPTPAIVGRQTQGQSGRALLAEQQAGMTEMAGLLGQFDDWTLRIFRAMWFCIRQFWDQPKYIRVTDDENAPKYVLLNGPIIDPQTGQPEINPQTGQPVIHRPAMMDMDIIIDSTPDTASIQQEQYGDLVELTQMAVQAQMPQAPALFEAVIEASSLHRKKQVLEKLKPQEPSPEQQMQQELQMRGAVAKIAVDETKAEKTQAETAKIAQEAQMVGLEPQIRMAEHQGEMQMAHEDHAMKLEQGQQQHQLKMAQGQMQAQLKAAQGAQQLQQSAVEGAQSLQMQRASFEQKQAEAKANAKLKAKQPKGRAA